MKKKRTSLFRKFGDVDFDAAALGCFGLSARCIGQMTGLSAGQAYYRCRLAGVRLRDYRNGKGRVFEHVIKKNKSFALAEVDDYVRKTLTRELK